MPWKESRLMDERVRFIRRLMEGERMTDLCEEFGISRKTAYKFRSRFLAHGIRGLFDQSRRPNQHPHHTPKEIEKVILALRKSKPSWGPKKLKTKLEGIHPGLKIPSPSTIGEILRRYQIPLRKRRLRKYVPWNNPLKESQEPNDIWCVDFKGQFRLGNGKYCYPLTVSDHYSRYFLGCDALEDTKGIGVMSTFENIFKQYGLPRVIRSDNGPPFASRGLNGWSYVAVWWMRLGIDLERIEPGHPEQNGRHERLHCTLKYETTRPAKANLFQQQERFDEFREEYNQERPHEALEMKTPASVYQRSEKIYPEELPELNYPNHDDVCVVHPTGMVYLGKRRKFYLSNALSGEKVGIREIKPKCWLVSFLGHDLGYFNEKTKTFSQDLT